MYNIPWSVAQINNKCVLKSIGEVCSLFRDSSGCKRICSWTDHLHYPDHPTVSIVGCAKHLKRLLDYHQTESSDFFFFFFYNQGCEHSHHGAACHGLCPQDLLCKEHHWSYSLLPLQQAVQDEKKGLNSVQVVSFHVSQSR